MHAGAGYSECPRWVIPPDKPDWLQNWSYSALGGKHWHRRKQIVNEELLLPNCSPVTWSHTISCVRWSAVLNWLQLIIKQKWCCNCHIKAPDIAGEKTSICRNLFSLRKKRWLWECYLAKNTESEAVIQSFFIFLDAFTLANVPLSALKNLTLPSHLAANWESTFLDMCQKNAASSEPKISVKCALQQLIQQLFHCPACGLLSM